MSFLTHCFFQLRDSSPPSFESSSPKGVSLDVLLADRYGCYDIACITRLGTEKYMDSCHILLPYDFPHPTSLYDVFVLFSSFNVSLELNLQSDTVID